MTDISRREFVVTSALAGIGLSAGSLPAATGADSAAQGDWFDRPMRWAQLTLVENDPGRFDPQFWLDYFTRIHADAACLSAGGVIARGGVSVCQRANRQCQVHRRPEAQRLRAAELFAAFPDIR